MELTFRCLLVLTLCIASDVLKLAFHTFSVRSLENSGKLDKSNNEIRLERKDHAVVVQLVTLSALVIGSEGLYCDLSGTVQTWA